MSPNKTSDVRNIYPDEQQKIEDRIKDEAELAFKINALLEDYGFRMTAVLKDGMPEISFSKV